MDKTTRKEILVPLNRPLAMPTAVPKPSPKKKKGYKDKESVDNATKTIP